MRLGTLYVKIDGVEKVVAPCTVDMGDGGVFVAKEAQRETRRIVSWFRIGTIELSGVEGAPEEDQP